MFILLLLHELLFFYRKHDASPQHLFRDTSLSQICNSSFKGVYLPLRCKLLRYKTENICFNICQKITLNLYCLVLFVCDWTVTAITSLCFYIILSNEWKALLDSISLKIIPEKFCDYLSPQCIIGKSRGQKYWWEVNTVRGTCWITDLAVSSIDQHTFPRAL